MAEYLKTTLAKHGLPVDAYKLYVDGASDYDIYCECEDLLDKNHFSRPLTGSYVYYLSIIGEIVAVAEVDYTEKYRQSIVGEALSVGEVQAISVDPRRQNQHFGSILLNVIIEDATALRHISELNISSKPQASGFYDRLVDLGIIERIKSLKYVARLHD